VIISLIIIIVISYILLQAIETIAFGSRVAGRVVARHALGTTLQQSLFTGSRLFLVFLLPALAYLVEKKIDIELYTGLVITSLFLSFLIACFVLFKLNSFQKFFQKIFTLYDGQHMPVAITKVIFGKSKLDSNLLTSIPDFSMEHVIQKKIIVSFIANTFLTTGFFVTFLLALTFFEYRLTLSQLSAFFHGVGAIIVGFYLDPMLSRSIDAIDDDKSWLMNVYSIFLGRILSYLISSMAFIVVFIVNI